MIVPTPEIIVSHAYHAPWVVDPVKVLTRRELARVLESLTARADDSPAARMNLTIVRLACCCGLRVSEIGGLVIDDLRVDSGRPHSVDFDLRDRTPFPIYNYRIISLAPDGVHRRPAGTAESGSFFYGWFW